MLRRNQPDYQRERERMVERQLRGRGIENEDLLEVFLHVPRHRFVSSERRSQAYGDFPLPSGQGQTISQPYMVALMTELLEVRENDEVLEIGTGTGYQTAILSELARIVYTVERNEELLERARRTLEELGYENIRFRHADGTVGWKEFAPYQKIIGTGGVPSVPASLTDQMADPGRLVIPVGRKRSQVLSVVDKRGGELSSRESVACSFVPLVGEEGWSEPGL
ncbi:MAG: protein-L-isoaspartate(D-aspartate) O-methyltransferase [Candidatus Bipolaricaulota bacterium]